MALAILKDPSALQGEAHFFKITICSSRDLDGDADTVDFVLHESTPGTFIPARCTPTDDAGGPGDRVTVVLDFNHPLVTPFLTTLWPKVHLISRRDGVVERFRTSRVINLPLDIALPSFTPTPSPTYTNTPSPTPSPTNTTTSTVTQTALPSATPPPHPKTGFVNKYLYCRRG